MFGELLLIFPSTPFPSSAPSHHEGRGTLFGKYEHLFVTGFLDDYESLKRLEIKRGFPRNNL